MTALPYDVSRCRPVQAGELCANCKRWVDHPEQVFGNVTPLVQASWPKSAACVHVPISLNKETK